jgi:aromatic-L-amino-acid decarboxylase
MTNFDCSAHFVREPEALIRTFSVLPDYLRSREQGAVIDYRDWGVALGRRFRALKLWFVIRTYGVARLQAMLRRHIAWTGELAEQIAAEPDFELTSPPNLALLTFRYRPGGEDDATLDRLNERLLNALNDEGRLYLTQTRVRGRYVIRFAIGQTYTERHHVRQAWSAISETARGLTLENQG